MPWRKGEVSRCPDPSRGCEITVTKEPKPGMGGDRAPIWDVRRPNRKENRDEKAENVALPGVHRVPRG